MSKAKVTVSFVLTATYYVSSTDSIQVNMARVTRELRNLEVPDDNVDKLRSKFDVNKKFRSKLLNLGRDVSRVNFI